jgi:DnaK suppressor protein
LAEHTPEKRGVTGSTPVSTTDESYRSALRDRRGALGSSPDRMSATALMVAIEHNPRSRLNDLRATTLRRAASLAGSFDDIVEAASDVATDDEHDPEGHTIAWERQQIAALLTETRTTLAQIDAAERRLEVGAYGTCTTCGREIAAERLDALPATPTCVNCAK